MPDLPQADDADMSTVISAALGVLFATHPDKKALLKAWEPVAAAIPLTIMKNGAKKISHNANVVLAQALLAIARAGAGLEP